MKIKNSIKLIISTLILSSFIYSGSVTPVLALRFNDIAGSTDLQGPSQTLGLKMDVGSGVYSGFDTKSVRNRFNPSLNSLFAIIACSGSERRLYE